MEYTDLEIARELAIQHQQEILIGLGLEPDRKGNVKCTCPIHGGDHPSGFSYEARRSIWRCWTRHCHKEFGGDLLGLIRGILQCTLDDAVRFVKDFHNGEFKVDGINVKAYLRSVKPQREKKTFSLTGLGDDAHKVDYFIKRGLNVESLEQFKAFYCNKSTSSLYGRACFPIFDKNNDVVGFTGRDVKNVSQRKWLHSPNAVPVSECLFGLYQAQKTIKETGTALLVEGPLDVIKLHQNSIQIAVSPLGTNLSMDQIKLLISIGVKSLILALDPDEGGDKGTFYILEKAKLYFQTFDIRYLFDKDPSDLEDTYIVEKIVPEVNKIISDTQTKYNLKGK